MKTNSYEPKR